MALERILPDQAAEALATFDAIIDARSESEFALDRLPGAVNWPVLNDAQRHAVGTEYKQISAFDARKRGAVMAARNIATHIEREATELPRNWRPLVYCWRGGQRSGSLALVLSQIGFAVNVLDGGYRAFRKHMLERLDVLPQTLEFRAICGTTGSGKSRLLDELTRQGAQVLDLEGLACHRGSVLGALEGGQPSQKAFEMRLWDTLRQLDPALPVFVESESRTIGRLRLPEPLLLRMRASPCIALDTATGVRIELLMADYTHHMRDVEGLCQRLDSLMEIRGRAVVENWKAMAHSGEWADLVAQLLEQHYDPIYLRSMARNFAGFANALPIQLISSNPSDMAAAASELLHKVHADRGQLTA